MDDTVEEQSPEPEDEHEKLDLDIIIQELAEAPEPSPMLNWKIHEYFQLPELIETFPFRRDFTLDLSECLNLITELLGTDWWLEGLGERRTAIKNAGDVHMPIGMWECSLQHIQGGKLTIGEGMIATHSVLAAICEVRRGLRNGRWHD